MNALDVVIGEERQFYVRWAQANGAPVVDMTTASAEVQISGVGAIPADGYDVQTAEWTFVIPAEVTSALDPKQRARDFQVWVQEADGGRHCIIPRAVLVIIPAVSGAGVAPS